MSLTRRSTFLGFVLAIIVFGAFYPALQGGFIWDDDHYVTANPALTAHDGLSRIWFDREATPQYYPLVHTLYRLEHKLWGFNPLGYHAVNLCLHILAALLLWRALFLLQIPGAWLAALLFAVHPVQVETVAWITERKNVLSGVFYLGSGLCLLRYFFPSGDKAPSSPWYWAGLVLYVCALLSKTTSATLPLAVMVVLWFRRGRVSLKESACLAPFIFLGLVFGLHTAWLEVHHVGAWGEDWALSPVQKIILAGRSSWFYALKLLAPVNLAFNYPRWDLDASRWSLYLYPAGMILLAGLLWRLGKRISRGPLAGMLFFLIGLFPALGFFRVYPFRYSYVADHFQYLACIGLLALAGAAAARLYKRRPVPAGALSFLAAAVLCVLTWNQASLFKDSQTLWERTLEINPHSYQAHNDLGAILAGQGNLDEAVEHFRQAAAIQPNYPEAWNNLSQAGFAAGDYAKAKALAEKALSLDPVNSLGHWNAGMACLRLHDRHCALKHIAWATASDPDWGRANLMLAKLLAGEGHPAKARVFLENALAVMPESLDAHLVFAQVWEDLGEYRQALGLYDQALLLDPDNPAVLYGKAQALFHAGYRTEGAALMEFLTASAPDNPGVNYNYGLMLLALGDGARAQAYLEKALAAKPDFWEARKALEIARRKKNPLQ